MPPSHVHRLQHNMYALYRQYYAARQLILLRAADFSKGTVRIRSPGLYVLAEDVIFQPDPHYLTTDSDYTTNPMFTMGFFAAITIECPGVILDLQGKTIRQSFQHYFEQRFFSVIELADSSFIRGQGPGAVNISENYEGGDIQPAKDCLILNGVIGLSSHAGIHGNNNTNVMLQNLVIQDFEVAGIQLNGIHNAFIDRVKIGGIACVPIAADTFSLILHSREFNNENAIQYNDASGNESPIATGLKDLVDTLRAPFLLADQTVHTTTVGKHLKLIHTALKTAILTNPALERYVTPAGLPDGSAMYGILISSTGVAVDRLSESCALNGGNCPKSRCPLRMSMSAASHSYAGERRSYEVALHAVCIEQIQINSSEYIILQRETKIVRDFTGAVINMRTLTSPPALHDVARATLGQKVDPPEEFESVVRSLLLGDTTVTELLATGTTSFGYNGDVMAHVSKGCFGIRVEDTNRVCIENVTLKDINNITTPIHPTEIVPNQTATFVSLTRGSPDIRTTYAFAGCDTRALYIGNCQYVHIHNLQVQNLLSECGLVRGCECDSSSHILIYSVQCIKFQGRNIHAIIIQDDCRTIRLQNLNVKELSALSDDEDEDLWRQMSEADRVIFWKRLERRAVRLDPRTLTYEAVPTIANCII